MQDGTLALQRSQNQFPKDADDWVLYNKSVPDKLKELQSEGYKLVLFRSGLHTCFKVTVSVQSCSKS